MYPINSAINHAIDRVEDFLHERYGGVKARELMAEARVFSWVEPQQSGKMVRTTGFMMSDGTSYKHSFGDRYIKAWDGLVTPDRCIFEHFDKRKVDK